MDYQIIWEPRAIEDLAQIVRFIAGDNSVAAQKAGTAILQKAALLASFPRIGRAYSKLNRDDVREFPFPPYRIFYHVKDSQRVVRILKIWHGARREPYFDGMELND